MSKLTVYCVTCGKNLPEDCGCKTPANLSLNLYRRLHNIHKNMNPDLPLTKELGNVCDELLDLTAILVGEEDRH